MHIVAYKSDDSERALVEIQNGVVLEIWNIGTAKITCAVLSKTEESARLANSIHSAFNVDVLTTEHLGAIAVWSSPKTIANQVLNFLADY